MSVWPREIIVMTSGAFTAPYLALVPQFELTTKIKIVTATTDMGTGPDSIPDRLLRGEPVDVVIVADAALADMIRNGQVAAGSSIPLALSAIGMAVRAGASAPDISSVAALKRTLLEAKSVAYSASVSGRYISGELLAQLGIADELACKCMEIKGERVGAVVARGDAEIGFQQISALLPVPGITYAGPLPPEVQRVSVFSAGIASHARDVDAAGALIRFLTSPAAAQAITQSGLAPAANR